MFYPKETVKSHSDGYADDLGLNITHTYTSKSHSVPHKYTVIMCQTKSGKQNGSRKQGIPTSSTEKRTQSQEDKESKAPLATKGQAEKSNAE